VTRPAVWLLSRSTDLTVRMLGGDPTRRGAEVTQEELRDLVATQVCFTAQQRRIIDGAFEISRRSLGDVLRPRPDVFVLDADQDAAQALTDLVASGHSRAPVARRRDLDEVVGFVHLRDLLDRKGAVRTLASPLAVFPESAPALDVLRDLQARRSQIALVVDEHGAAAGIVTVEDLLEELVGEIYDESDPDNVSVQAERDGSVVLPGRFPVHDLPDIGIADVPDGPYATVAGLVIDRLGRIPDVPGDQVEIAGRLYEVRGVNGRAITEVRVVAAPGRVRPRVPGTRGERIAATIGRTRERTR
jgi:putative hemolysin